MQGLQLITSTPAHQLEFLVEFQKLAHSSIVLTNIHQRQVSFKVKTTKPNLFQVKPSVGLIPYGQSVTIDITTNAPAAAGAQAEIAQTKFQIIATECEDDKLGGQDVTAFWKTRSQEQQQTITLKSIEKKNHYAEPIIEEPPSKMLESMDNSVSSSIYKSTVNVDRTESNAQQQFQPQIPTLQSTLYQQELQQSKVEKKIQEQQDDNKEIIQTLRKEIADLRVSHQSLEKRQEMVKNEAVTFTLRQMIIMIVVSLILGALIRQ